MSEGRHASHPASGGRRERDELRGIHELRVDESSQMTLFD